MSAVAWRDELAAARAVATERKRAWEEAPELTADQILEGFKRELRSTVVEGFGRVYFYYPMSAAEHFELRSKVPEDGVATAANVADAIVAFARNSDGSLKFRPEHAAAILQAPTAAVMKLAGAVVSGHGFSVVSAEKK